jgi:regulator of sigma E protease
MIESSGFGYSLLMFLIVLTVLVFVHEMGHYWVARRNGVRVDVFSIGFGPEIFGWTDSVGTRWKVSWIPLGGYVKFFGDMDAASRPDPSMSPETQNALATADAGTAGPSTRILTPEERAVAFPYKKLWQRAAIVAAGPLANFVFAIVVFTGLFMTIGQPYTPALVGAVDPGSAAESAGIHPGDRIVSVDGTTIDRFEDLMRIVTLSPEQSLKIVVSRNGQDLDLTATPKAKMEKDSFGEEHRLGDLGVNRAAYVGDVMPGSAAEQAGIRTGDRIIRIASEKIENFDDLARVIGANPQRALAVTLIRDDQEIVLSVTPQLVTEADQNGVEQQKGRLGVNNSPERERLNPIGAVWQATAETGTTIKMILKTVGQLFTGERSREELRGPLTIAKMSGTIAKTGVVDLINFMALLSINLGLINLFPIPMLDGGHLLFYAFEAVRGRPLGLRAQEYGFRIGLVVVLFLMVQAIWNDFKSLSVFEYVSGLFS